MTRDALRRFRKLLGEDLWRLAERRPGTLVSADELTTLPSRTLDRGSFRLSFDDGEVLKGRRLLSAEVAERIERLVPLMGDLPFANLIARRGTALLMEWVPGEALISTASRPGLARACGEIMGRLHAVSLPEATARRYGTGRSQWDSRMKSNVEALVARVVLERAEGDRALALVAAAAPPDVEHVIVHGDLCSENLIVTAADELRVVDNETLSVDVPAYDLARTWYRWPLEGKAGREFCEGYARYRALDDLDAHFLYWAIAVLAEAALFRSKGDTPDRAVPLGRLRRVIQAGSARLEHAAP